jgi:hypothetical protein
MQEIDSTDVLVKMYTMTDGDTVLVYDADGNEIMTVSAVGATAYCPDDHAMIVTTPDDDIDMTAGAPSLNTLRNDMAGRGQTNPPGSGSTTTQVPA